MELEELLRLDKELRATASRRLLIADAVLIAFALLAYSIAASFASREVLNVVRAVCFVVGFVQVAVVICLIADLLGYPVELGFGVGPTPAGKVFIRRLKDRQPIADEEFCERFGNRYRLSSEQLTRLREVLRSMDSLCDRVLPEEVIAAVLYDLDFEDLYCRLEKEFGVKVIAVGKCRRDGTLDMVIMDVQEAVMTMAVSRT